jgi:hypothetical protein
MLHVFIDFNIDIRPYLDNAVRLSNSAIVQLILNTGAQPTSVVMNTLSQLDAKSPDTHQKLELLIDAGGDFTPYLTDTSFHASAEITEILRKHIITILQSANASSTIIESIQDTPQSIYGLNKETIKLLQDNLHTKAKNSNFKSGVQSNAKYETPKTRKASKYKKLVNNTEEGLPLPNGWTRKNNEKGGVYYHHESNNSYQYNRPLFKERDPPKGWTKKKNGMGQIYYYNATRKIKRLLRPMPSEGVK